MNELQISIALLLVISFSATIVGYLLYLEYIHSKHLTYIKNVISLDDDEVRTLLQDKEKAKNDKSLLFIIESITLRAGFEFPIIVFVLAFVTFIFIIGSLFALFLQHWSGYVIGFPFGAMIFSMIVGSIINRRKKSFNRSLATSISVLVKMMKNGIGFEQALLKSVAVSGSETFKNHFSVFFQEKNTIGEIEAFTNLNKLVNSKELLIFALAIKIGRASGGQFSNTLEKVEQTISYRKKMQDKVDVITREGSFGSYIVVGIAIFLYFSLNGNFDGKLHAYFMESQYGRFQLLGIALWIFIGMIVNKLITRVDK